MLPRGEMEPIRVVWGTGTGPTALAAKDAALSAANVHQYNLVTLSSVIPAKASIEEINTAPSLGPVGGRLHVVSAIATADTGPATAVLAWARRDDETGIFYEAADQAPTPVVTDQATQGIQFGMDLRAGTFEEPQTRVATIDKKHDGYSCAAVLAVYGRVQPLLTTG